MRATARALTPFEVAVRRRRTALAGREDVRVHAEAHRAAGTPPLEARRLEHLPQTFVFGLALDLRRTRHDDRLAAVCDPPARDDLGSGTQILDARVRAGADEHLVDA